MQLHKTKVNEESVWMKTDFKKRRKQRREPKEKEELKQIKGRMRT